MIYNILYKLILTRCITLCNTPCTRVIFRLTQCIHTLLVKQLKGHLLKAVTGSPWCATYYRDDREMMQLPVISLTPSWHIRLKACVDLGDQTTEFIHLRILI